MLDRKDSKIALPQGAGFVALSGYNPTKAEVRPVGGDSHLIALNLKDHNNYVSTVALTAEAWQQVIASVQALLAEMSVTR